MDNTNKTTEIKYIPMYKSYIDAVAQLPNEDRLAIYEAIFNYGFTGEEPTFDNPYLLMGWNLVKPNLVNNINNAIKNQENGKKGGRPKKSNDVSETSTTSIENKPLETTISIEDIIEDQVEEIVSEIEDNNTNSVNVFQLTNREIQKMGYSDEKIGHWVIPNAYLPYIHLIKDYKGIINSLTREYSQLNFEVELSKRLKEYAN